MKGRECELRYNYVSLRHECIKDIIKYIRDEDEIARQIRQLDKLIMAVKAHARFRVQARPFMEE